MKTLKIIITIFLLSLGCCTSDRTNESDIAELQIPFSSIRIDKKEIDSFYEVAAIKKIVALETNPDCLIATVDRVKEDENNGDLVIGDYLSTKNIYRFNAQGKYLIHYGRHGGGPGEYLDLMGFDVTPGGNVIVLDYNKILLFQKDGTLIREKKIDYLPGEVVALDDRVFVYVARYRFAGESRRGLVKVLSMNLEQIDEIGEYDNRVNKYLYAPNHYMAKDQDSIYFLAYFDPKVNIYNHHRRELSSLILPNNNSAFDNIWDKKKLTEADTDLITSKLSRIRVIYSTRNPKKLD